MSKISFKKENREVELLVNNLFNYDSSKSTFFMLNVQLNVLLSTAFDKPIGIHSFLAMQGLQKHIFFVSCFDMYFSIKT